MSKIIKIAKTLRTHWKKSTVGFCLLAYGGSYVVERYKLTVMMRSYCAEAKKYGERTLPPMTKPKHITVILNPEANDKKSHAQFEKFAAPLLHLAGLKISVIQTDKEKQAQHLMQIMTNTDAVIIAGGDGTLHEAVTGLFRRPGSEDLNLTMGIVPLGKTNTVAHHLFGAKSSSNPQLMAEAVMAVIRETITKLDCMQIQFANEEKPVYGLCEFEEGCFAEVEPLVPKYWYLGALKEKYAYFKNSFKSWPSLKNEELQFVAPCSGCSKCYKPPSNKSGSSHDSRWWHAFVPKQRTAPIAAEENPMNKINDDCGKVIALSPEYSNMTVSTSAVLPNGQGKPGTIWIKQFPKDLTWQNFLQAGLRHRKSKVEDDSGLSSTVEARELFIRTERLEEDVSVSNSKVRTSVEVENTDESSSETHNSTFSVSVSAERPESTVDVEVDIGDAKELQTTSSNETIQNEANEKENDESEQKKEEICSYVDKEKYCRASCSIKLLPKQVAVYA